MDKMLDLKRIGKLLLEGNAVLTVNGDKEIMVLCKRFDPADGREVSPEYHYIKLEDLEKDLESLQFQIETLQRIIEGVKEISKQ